jgi:predicted dehydrogenase
MKIRLAIIGNGHQVREHHLPYIRKEWSDVELCWASGCTCTESEIPGCPLKEIGLVACCAAGTHLNNWETLLKTSLPTAVIISTPNVTHGKMIRQALETGVHVAVDKPPTISSTECRDLVNLAQEKTRIFLTISQRRYEDVYQAMKRRIEAGSLGQIRLINYFIAHSFGPKGWRRKRSLVGGGVLLDSAYHGIDTILWLLRCLPEKDRINPVRVSADWVLDQDEHDSEERVEMLGSIRIIMSNGCIFNVVASYESPDGSIDETIKIFGNRGTLRYVRDKLARTDMSSGMLTFQLHTGESFVDNDGQSQGNRWAPLEDFFRAIGDERSTVFSPAADSISVLQILEAAYQSAANGGLPVNLTI